MSDSCKTCPSKSDDPQGTCGTAKVAKTMRDLGLKSTLSKIKHKILVMSGKGGVGKSTVATNVALGLAKKGFQVGLIDVDLHGPDICRMLDLNMTIGDIEKTNDLVPPMPYGDNLKVISLEYMMENRDDPIIWRGPLKIQAIRQFIADIDWGDLDYLIIDAPPGTGDEPLTVASTIKDAIALVVTTPQEIALADVRKSLNFCKHVKMDVLGLVENMSGLVCPHCDKTVDLFKSGGGSRTAAEFSVSFLGGIPLDPKITIGGDAGQPYLVSESDSPAVKAFSGLLDSVIKATENRVSLAAIPEAKDCGCGGSCDPDACDC